MEDHCLVIESSSSSSSDEAEDVDELDPDEEEKETVSPAASRRTRASRSSVRTTNTAMKAKTDDDEVEITLHTVKRSSRMAKARRGEKHAHDEHTDSPHRNAGSKKASPRKNKKKDDSPEVSGLYDTKGRRILVAPYFDSLPSALLQVSDPILEELEGELVCEMSHNSLSLLPTLINLRWSLLVHVVLFPAKSAKLKGSVNAALFVNEAASPVISSLPHRGTQNVSQRQLDSSATNMRAHVRSSMLTSSKYLIYFYRPFTTRCRHQRRR